MTIEETSLKHLAKPIGCLNNNLKPMGFTSTLLKVRLAFEIRASWAELSAAWADGEPELFPGPSLQLNLFKVYQCLILKKVSLGNVDQASQTFL